MSQLRQRKKARTEAAILRATAALIARRGFAQTTVEDIARRAQVGVGTVYNYFGSKNALLLALMERDTRDLLSEGETVLTNPAEKPESALTALFSIYARGFLVRYERKMLREIFALAFYQPEELGQRITRLDFQLMQQVSQLLAEYQRRGVLRKSLPLDPATMVLYAAFAILVMMYLQYEEMTLESVQAQMGASIQLILDDWREGQRHARRATENAP